MTPDAILTAILMIGTIWGGLAGAIIHLRRHPEQSGE